MCPDDQLDTEIEGSPTATMLGMISGFWLSRALYAAAKLGLADLVKREPCTVEELAKASGTHGPSLYRLLRALASRGVFKEDADGRFSSTPLSRALESDAPGSLRGFVIAELGEDHYPAWSEFLHSIRSGGIAFDHVFGTSVWQWRAQHSEDARIFDQAMASYTTAVNESIIRSYDFSPFRKIVDVGGGDGSLMVGILKANPAIDGLVFDLPHAAAHARARLQAAALTERCQVVEGDFFKSVPDGRDAYLLKWIIHDWDDDQAVAILRNCRRAMPQHAKLLLIEGVIPPGNAPSFHKFGDLNMLVMTGGRERTEAEYGALATVAGLRLARTVRTDFELSVLEVEHGSGAY